MNTEEFPPRELMEYFKTADVKKTLRTWWPYLGPTWSLFVFFWSWVLMVQVYRMGFLSFHFNDFTDFTWWFHLWVPSDLCCFGCWFIGNRFSPTMKTKNLAKLPTTERQICSNKPLHFNSSRTVLLHFADISNPMKWGRPFFPIDFFRQKRGDPPRMPVVTNESV